MKGQIAVFLILGLIIIASFILVYALNKTSMLEENVHAIRTTPEMNVMQIRANISSCLQQQFDTVLETALHQGGVYYTDVDSKEYAVQSQGDHVVPFFYQYGRRDIPTTQQIINNLSAALVIESRHCSNVSDVAVFPSVGERVSARINFPVQVSTENKIVTLEDFHVQSHLNVSNFINISHQVDQFQKRGFCVSCLNELPEVSYREWVYEDRVDRLYSVNDTFYFAHRINRSLGVAQSAVLLEDVPDQYATANYPFVYNLTLSGRGVEMRDNTDLFEVEEGKINFTPGLEDVGRHLIAITAENSQGSKTVFFNLTVDTLVCVPTIHYIGGHSVGVGEPFIYNVTATCDEPVFFFDDTELFNISDDGMINFTPEVKGEYVFNISVLSNSGGTDSQDMQLRVE
ncbi:MAG: hypothetical protein ACQESG_00295 [Nanobdellota archaeon]